MDYSFKYLQIAEIIRQLQIDQLLEDDIYTPSIILYLEDNYELPLVMETFPDPSDLNYTHNLLKWNQIVHEFGIEQLLAPGISINEIIHRFSFNFYAPDARNIVQESLDQHYEEMAKDY